VGVKFLQGSDFSIGYNFHILPKKLRDRLRKNQLKVFNDFVDRCEKEDYEALLIPGNLFYSREAGKELGKEVLETFRKLLFKSKSILLTTGNQDWFNGKDDDFWMTSSIPLSFSFYKSNYFSQLVLQKSNITIGGIAFDNLNRRRRVLKEELDGSLVIKTNLSILIFCGTLVEDHEKQGDNQPFLASEVDSSPFTYVAIGGSIGLKKCGSKGYYSGSPQAISFDKEDLGERYFLEVELMSDRTFNVKPIKSEKAIIFESKKEDISRWGKDQVMKYLEEESEEKIVRKEISGEVSEDVFNALFEKEMESENDGTLVYFDSLFPHSPNLPDDKKRFVEACKLKFSEAKSEEEKKTIRGAIYWGLKVL